MRNSSVVITAGFVFLAIGVFFWPMLLIAIPMLLVGGMIRQGERWRASKG